MHMIRHAVIALAFAAAPASAADLTDRVRTTLAEAGPGTRFGLLVTTREGREIVAISPDDRFVPASNTKMFTTAAAFDTLTTLDKPDDAGGTAVALDGKDVVLGGRGDARLSSAPDCVTDCLAALADAVRKDTKRVRDVIGDDSLFADERWSPGMSWNNIPTRSGTGISALSLDDNEVRLTVSPTALGAPPKVESLGYFDVDNRATTVAAGQPTALETERLPLERRLRLTGTIALDSAARPLQLGIDDPAHYAAWRFAALLRERGVRVTGTIRPRHRDTVVLTQPGDLTRLSPPPLIEDLRMINKVSQNLHAELMLRRIGLTSGTASIASGQAVVTAMLTKAAVPRWAYDFSDGSGMSSYNRVTPRATVGLLRWTTTQPWGEAYRATFPIGGVDGTLSRRFKATPLEGKVFAKTGTLNQANALGGFLTAKSGKTLVFAVYAADMPGDASATKAVDAALNLIAAEN
jgi:D-alanyl-D-alanine carboxypeptidase/D-alanyl-D-alanine-endopeptidase (penicillin-binding protein 4)